MRGPGGDAPPGAPETFPAELTDALVGIQRLIRRRLRGGLAGPRLRGAEVELLRLVGTRPGIGVSEAAKELHLAGNSVSTLVNQLVRDAYLVRETDPADRRAARLRLTGAAEKRLEDWHRRRAELVGGRLARLDGADRDALRAALPALRRLAGLLREDDEAGEDLTAASVGAPAGAGAAPEGPWTEGTPS
ncbi:MarR family winged helix-turn-helix transcriptional regulator [Streptomyces sp. HF10]|uniref:MarR family winged helix-turn-helix transcriptional regulator n=1 Tax=Streptomyces sp. HF10 TaxID=2692233 RepID=UPI001318357B|nr:MarR family transcriptional regulator [Streptomyces sp. HF10]QHC33212.1 MarR family transcriptional regulator [Streptomyces sp. HF10]